MKWPSLRRGNRHSLILIPKLPMVLCEIEVFVLHSNRLFQISSSQYKDEVGTLLIHSSHINRTDHVTLIETRYGSER